MLPIETQIVVAGREVTASSHEGTVWLTAQQVADALEFKSGQAGVMKLYRRHATELRQHAREAVVDAVSSVAGAKRVTCFSPEALAIFACVARTPRARAFRAAIAEHMGAGVRAVLDPRDAPAALERARGILRDARRQLLPLAEALVEKRKTRDAGLAIEGAREALKEQRQVLAVAVAGGARALAPAPSRERIDDMDGATTFGRLLDRRRS